jgi:hypothetical protein
MNRGAKQEKSNEIVSKVLRDSKFQSCGTEAVGSSVGMKVSLK